MVEFLGILSVGYPCRSDRTGLLSPQLSLLSQTVGPLREKKQMKNYKVVKKKSWGSIRAEKGCKKILRCTLIQNNLVNTSTLPTLTQSKRPSSAMTLPEAKYMSSFAWEQEHNRKVVCIQASDPHGVRTHDQSALSDKHSRKGLLLQGNRKMAWIAVRILKCDFDLLHLARRTKMFKMKLL